MIDRFDSEGLLPNFRRFRNESLVYTTEPAEIAPNLEPWIQWVTVHTGLDYADHQVFRLNEGHLLETKRIWDIVSEAGRNVLICGSMNVNCKAGLRGAMLPDPWCTHVSATPTELVPIVRFIQQNVLEYSRDRIPNSYSQCINIAAYLAGHGLSATTVTSIFKQLFSERLGGQKWKRATVLDKLQFDVFRWYWRRLHPALSTFFLNSTAHFQHAYWRNMAPEMFTKKPSEADQRRYSSAILYGYQQMDGILGRFMRLAGNDATLVFCSALGQQPFLRAETKGGQHFYRVCDFGKLARFAGITNLPHVLPVMAHQFHLEFKDEATAIDAERAFQSIQWDGRQALALDRKGSRLFTGCQIGGEVPLESMLTIVGTDRKVGFFEMFYSLDAVKSGMHHPDGMLWIRTPEKKHREQVGKVPLGAVAPTILRMLELEPPAFMTYAPLDLSETAPALVN